ncbi:amidohydrolase family protein [Actomonas aquatica]|uniref:Amidohydrolase family protein n=1 Tax=Actomonas aquatica TaxID=2866162 RepID=A0ABZ1CDI6_9BACT|nr:amidohydrolase family protein [Opitutus sp. WL0086]WRQ89741.1 amidohydrolase family protein [Opitutus sp. WL0086]
MLKPVTFVALVCSVATLFAQESPVAYTGARILPITGDPIETGVLVIQDGKILAVGAEGSVEIPADAQTIDVGGKVIMPGLVDSHSHIGGWPGFSADNSDAIQPSMRALDGIDARDATVQRAQAGGITTANLMPGSGHLISGQTIYAKLRDVGTVDEMLITLPNGRTAGGLKMANGTNSIRQDKLAKFPGSRAKSAALVREAYIAAQEYRDKLAAAGDDPEKKPARDLGMEILVEVLDGERVVQHHTHRHDDIITVLRLKQEFGFNVVLHHVSEGWKVADQIAAAGVPCSLIVLDSPGGKLEAADFAWRTGAALEKAGVMVGFHTDDYITDSRLFLRTGALAVRGGMTPEGALRGLTINNAKILGLDDRVGSLEAGKDADFLVLSGDPLSVYTVVEQTFVEGQRVFDRSDPEDHLFAVGGFGASSPVAPYLCCYSSQIDFEHTH